VDGFGLIEVVVALGVLMAILVPVTILVYNGQTASSQLRLRAEAADLASEALQNALNRAAYGQAIDTGPYDLGTKYVGTQGDPFHVELDYEIGYQNQAGEICTNPSNGDTNERSDIFTVSAIVTWNHGGGLTGRIVQTTNLAPPGGEFTNPNATEVAVPVVGTDDNPVASAINVRLTCQLTGGQSGSCDSDLLPGYVDSGNAQTVNGCAVFTDAWTGSAAVPLTYTVQVADNPGWVSSGQLSDAPTATGLPTESGIVPIPDGVAVAQPAFQMATGTPASVGFTSYWTPTSTPLPITVTADVTGQGQSWILGEPGLSTQSFSTDPSSPSQALLYPAGSYDVWAGDLASSASVEDPVTYGDNDLATILTPQAAATVQTPDSATPGLPLYPLELDLTNVSPQPSSISAAVVGDPADPGGSGWPTNVSLHLSCTQSADPGAGVSPAGPSGPVTSTTTSTTTSSTTTISPSGPTGATGATGPTGPSGPTGQPGWSCTGVPLGEYDVTVPSSGNQLSLPYVWVTPYGMCASSAPFAPNPPSTPVVPNDASTCGTLGGSWYHDTPVPEG
jgi:type II secretory pathway pseudopilin PulG